MILSLVGIGSGLVVLLGMLGAGILSLVVLAAATAAFSVHRLAGVWRWIYAGTAVLALYLNVFVGVVQAFEKLPFLSRLAPTQSEPPFLIAQRTVLALFIALGVLAVMKFHPPATRPA